jgi:hypothetical protein
LVKALRLPAIHQTPASSSDASKAPSEHPNLWCHGIHQKKIRVGTLSGNTITPIFATSNAVYSGATFSEATPFRGTGNFLTFAPAIP